MKAASTDPDPEKPLEGGAGHMIYQAHVSCVLIEDPPPVV